MNYSWDYLNGERSAYIKTLELIDSLLEKDDTNLYLQYIRTITENELGSVNSKIAVKENYKKNKSNIDLMIKKEKLIKLKGEHPNIIKIK